MYGDFVFADMETALMTKLHPTLAEYQEMVLGLWAWSTDGGDTQTAFLILKDDKVCQF